ncbi:cation:proton antiporter [Neoroseomonas alba]|uniref:cation:proton antiporter n=1 Tax=Roseomonas alba TaxID=2846776 RepID=UPI0034E302D5
MELIAASVFYEVAALLALGAAAGLAALFLRQPLIVGLIGAGIIAGPAVLGVARSDEHIDLLAELGIAVLLFLVGLKLDIGLIRSLGAVALATGLGQVTFTAVVGFGLCLLLGLDTVTSIYVAVALTFSSTIIIVKLLSDKREIDSLHGRIALGFLIVQDIVVVIAMVVVSALAAGVGEAALGGLLRVAAGGVAMLVFVGLVIRFAAEPLTARLAHAPELLAGFAIGWAALLAAVGDALGIGKEIGGLLAGVALASTQFREAIAARLSALRDFLLLFFFIALGARLDLGAMGEQLGAAAVLSVFVLVGNPLIVVAIMGAMGYRRRTGFLAGLTVAQISEFSLILMAMGVALGHVAEPALGLVTLIGLITIALSTYMITHSHRLAAWFDRPLRNFERDHPWREAAETGGMAAEAAAAPDVVIFGLGRFGRAIAERLRARGLAVLGVDFDPEAVRAWRRRGFEAVYGDATDPKLVATLPLGRARWAISAIPSHAGGLTHEDHRLALIAALRGERFGGRIAVTAHGRSERNELLGRGADLVLLPFHDAAERAAELVAVKPEG